MKERSVCSKTTEIPHFVLVTTKIITTLYSFVIVLFSFFFYRPQVGLRFAVLALRQSRARSQRREFGGRGRGSGLKQREMTFLSLLSFGRVNKQSML